MSVFWTLVKNDLKFRRHRALRSIWSGIYTGVIVLLGLLFFSLQVVKGQVWPGLLLIGVPAMVFISFNSAIRTIKYEWRGETVAWWLSLPYPRWYLLAAKLMSSFIRYIWSLGLVIGISIIISLLGMILNPVTWNSHTLWLIITKGLQLYLFIILLSPAVMMMGMTMILLPRSRWKPLFPMFIIVMSFAFSGIFSISSMNNQLMLNKVIETGGGEILLHIGGVLLAGIITVVMFAFSTYLLERQIEV